MYAYSHTHTQTNANKYRHTSPTSRAIEAILLSPLGWTRAVTGFLRLKCQQEQHHTWLQQCMTSLPLTKPTESSERKHLFLSVCLAVSMHNSHKKMNKRGRKHRKKGKRSRVREIRGGDIKPKLGEKSGWRPKAIKPVLHVEPTNISEV